MCTYLTSHIGNKKRARDPSGSKLSVITCTFLGANVAGDLRADESCGSKSSVTKKDGGLNVVEDVCSDVFTASCVLRTNILVFASLHCDEPRSPFHGLAHAQLSFDIDMWFVHY